MISFYYITFVLLLSLQIDGHPFAESHTEEEQANPDQLQEQITVFPRLRQGAGSSRFNSAEWYDINVNDDFFIVAAGVLDNNRKLVFARVPWIRCIGPVAIRIDDDSTMLRLFTDFGNATRRNFHFSDDRCVFRRFLLLTRRIGRSRRRRIYRCRWARCYRCAWRRCNIRRRCYVRC